MEVQESLVQEYQWKQAITYKGIKYKGCFSTRVNQVRWCEEVKGKIVREG
jgi:hypothetical protein